MSDLSESHASIGFRWRLLALSEREDIMSRLRPTLISSNNKIFLDYSTTYFRVLEAVKRRRSLIHGQLKDRLGHTCAIGAYFSESFIPISTEALDEIAAYNDSFPKLSNVQRWRKVLAWLRYRVQQQRK